MTPKPENLNIARANKMGDNRLVSPREVLEDLLNDPAFEGATRMIVLFAVPKDKNDEEGEKIMSARFAGVTRPIVVEMLTAQIYTEMKESYGD